MSPRDKFDRYMVVAGSARHAKFRRLTTAERHAFFLGVLSLASQSPIRGCLLIGDLHADENDVAGEADVTLKEARSALEKLRQVGVIYMDEDLGCERVHDFDDYNPAPKKDATNAARQRRYQEKLKAARVAVTNGAHNGVTNGVSDAETPVSNALAHEEVEVEVPPVVPQGTSTDCEEWLLTYERITGHQLPARTTKAFKGTVESYGARRDEGHTAEDLLLAIDGAHSDTFRRENGYDTAESILRPKKIGSLIAKGRLRGRGSRGAAKTSIELAQEIHGGAA